MTQFSDTAHIPTGQAPATEESKPQPSNALQTQRNTTTSLHQRQNHTNRTASHETHEKHAKGEAQVGLNLNLLGAVSGFFSSLTRKKAKEQPDGSVDSVEDTTSRGRVDGVGKGRLDVVGRAKGETWERESRLKGVERSDGKEVGRIEGERKVLGKAEDMG